MSWDINKIKAILPQREPFLFIDEVLSIDESIPQVVAAKKFTSEEYFFKGHFPGNPVVPGVIIIEAMAQASIILYSIRKPDIAKSHPDYYLGRVKAEFISPVLPGSELILEVKGLKIIDSAGIVEASAKVNDKIVAKAQFTFGVKIKNAK